MKIGMFMMPLHPPDKDRTQTFEEDTECIKLADELGFSEAWIGQHHTAEWEPIPSNDIFIANLLPQTKNIRLGTGVTIVTQHHPVNVAVRLAYLDHLAKGRFNIGFGQGGVPTDWGLFDLPPPEEQGLMALEAIDLVLKLWQDEPPFQFDGNFWKIKIDKIIPELGLGKLLRPYQDPHPPIAMSIVKGESRAAKTAGRKGYIPISTNVASVPNVKRHWEIYSEGASEAGQFKPARSIWRVSRSIFVGDSDEEARTTVMGSSFVSSLIYLRGMLKMAGMMDLLKHDPEMPINMLDAEYIIDNIAIVGGVETVKRKLQDLYESTGGFGTLLMIAHDCDDMTKTQKSMELMAKEILPDLP